MSSTSTSTSTSTSNSFSITPSNIYVYLRVSTQAQTYKSNGLNEQCKLCQDYIKSNYSKNIPIEYYSDVGSSYNEKNTLVNLNKLIKEISKQKNTLILVRDISRLGRNVFQVFSLLRKIKKANSHIIGLEENLCWNHSRLMDKKFYHHIIDSEEHSDHKSIKSTNRIRQIKAFGGHVGKIPFGTKLIKKNNIPYIYKNSDEINLLKTIKNVFLKFSNVEKITEYLNNNNLKNRTKNWTPNQIINIKKKYFPNLIFNLKSNSKSNSTDYIDFNFTKYKDYDYEQEQEQEQEPKVETETEIKEIKEAKSKSDLESDIFNVTNTINNVNLNKNQKPKRKYIINK